ncbi:unnamed protein product [Acanthocheilonema viteae]|uniref:Uncharacterized protein n=1 Tax=Acanthocheilonema viteae TaxID=6277 RepID=A0A498S9V5_ACAVI|nr:unnamed protein product [Acanthocheilonema viteae]
MKLENELESSDSSLHGKRSNEESKAIHFIRSHLGIMRFGKRIRFDKRIDLDDTMHQNDKNSDTEHSNDYNDPYGKTSSFDYQLTF